MSTGSLDWSVQPQKILYLAYVNWGLLHSFLPLHPNNFFILLLPTYILQLTFSCSVRSKQGRGRSTLCHVLCDYSRADRLLDAS